MKRFLQSILAKHPTPREESPTHFVTPAIAAEEAKVRGNQHLTNGDLDQAAECYRHALRLNPKFAEAYNNLGHVLKEQRRLAEAAAMLDMALDIKSDLGPAHLNRGLVAMAVGQLFEAERFLKQAVKYMPTNAACHSGLGDLFFRQARFGEAIQAYESAIGIDAGLADVRVNLGSAYYKSAMRVEAEMHYRIAVDEFNRADAAYFLGILHQASGKGEEAGASYRKAIEIRPDYVQAHWNLAVLSLLHGDYSSETWDHFEKRLDISECDDGTIPLDDVKKCLPRFGKDRYWSGAELVGKRLLVWAEQGLGDSLMLMRFLPLLKDRGARQVLVYADPPLARIIGSVAGVNGVIPKTQPISEGSFDLHVSMFSLPARFNVGLDELSTRPSAYLTVGEDVVRLWGLRCSALGGRKVGLVWGGNKDMAKDALRSIALEAFSPLFDIGGIRWISLQKGEPARQLTTLDFPIVDWMDECQDMLDTAALVANLDLVISVDTSVAHLAGALGRPVWLLNRHESEWRWMLNREDSPWYPTMRIFTQPKPGDWASVIARTRSELGALEGVAANLSP